MALANTDVAISGIIRNQMYRKNIKKFELEFDDDYDILGCADVRYLKGMNDEYRVLMAVRNNKTGTVNFIMMKRPQSDGEIVNMTNPLENCSLETSFHDNYRGEIMKTTNLKVGIKQPRNKKNKNKTEIETKKTTEEYDYGSISEWSGDKEEEVVEMAVTGLNMFTLEIKTVYKIQILDTSDDTISGGWDGKIIKDILIDLKNGMGAKPCSAVEELRVH